MSVLSLDFKRSIKLNTITRRAKIPQRLFKKKACVGE
jgi:hypothetical protein